VCRKCIIAGKNYDVNNELQVMQAMVDETVAQKLTFRQAFRTTEAKRGLMIAFGLMIFQQLSGINAVIFYSTQIFEVSMQYCNILYLLYSFIQATCFDPLKGSSSGHRSIYKRS
jgi:heme A synthase